jgi:hypothetical protein
MTNQSEVCWTAIECTLEVPLVVGSRLGHHRSDGRDCFLGPQEEDTKRELRSVVSRQDLDMGDYDVRLRVQHHPRLEPRLHFHRKLMAQ